MSQDLHGAVAAWCDARRVRLMRSDVVDEPWWAPPTSNDPAAVAVADAARARALSRLTDPWATIPPLLTQLTAAVAPSGDVVDKVTGRGGASIVDWDAVDLLDRLRGVASEWAASAGLAYRPTLASRLRQLGGHNWEPGDAAMLARILSGLARLASGHLTPAEVAPWRYIRMDCSACGYRLLTTIGPDGTPVTGFALMVEFHRNFINRMVCQVCWTSWTRQDLADWASACAPA